MYGGDHNLLLKVRFNNIVNLTLFNLNPMCKQIMIYVGEMGERLLPTNANKYCNGVGKVTQDKIFKENFLYSCCEMANLDSCVKNTTGESIQCQYNCPAAPAEEIKFYEYILGINTRPIYIKSLKDSTEWLETDQAIIFVPELTGYESVQAFILQMLTFLTTITLIFTGVMTALNSAAEVYSKLLLYVHIGLTFVVSIILIIIKYAYVQWEGGPFMEKVGGGAARGKYSGIIYICVYTLENKYIIVQLTGTYICNTHRLIVSFNFPWIHC